MKWGNYAITWINGEFKTSPSEFLTLASSQARFIDSGILEAIYLPGALAGIQKVHSPCEGFQQDFPAVQRDLLSVSSSSD